MPSAKKVTHRKTTPAKKVRDKKPVAHKTAAKGNKGTEQTATTMGIATLYAIDTAAHAVADKDIFDPRRAPRAKRARVAGPHKGS